MKTCLACGTEAVDEQTICGSCGRQFSYVVGDINEHEAVKAAGEAKMRTKRNRPDGSGLKSTAAGLFVIGFFLFLLTIASNQYYFAIISGSLLSIALAIWLVGHIVEAMSFLPGKQDQ